MICDKEKVNLGLMPMGTLRPLRFCIDIIYNAVTVVAAVIIFSTIVVVVVAAVII